MSTPNNNYSTEVLREWKESAAFWRDHYPSIRTMFAPVTNALIEEAGIIEGSVVLDVAGGSGEPSLTIAELVGPRGSVTCTDAVADMVEARKLKQNDAVCGIWSFVSVWLSLFRLSKTLSM
jgi:2-polyprenyl-3-methyl-5-hydroxy-6-metoxy-1,4-benzoquinol methylase